MLRGRLHLRVMAHVPLNNILLFLCTLAHACTAFRVSPVVFGACFTNQISLHMCANELLHH